MTVAPFGPEAAVIVFALLSAVAWGAGDFGGGVATRRGPLFGVVLLTQALGMVVAVALVVASGEGVPGPVDLAWSVAAGLVGVFGILNLYRGLAVGRMGVVAPVTGVIAATVPVVAGVVLEGVPPPPVVVGIAVAVAAVFLVSRTVDDPVTAGRSGLEHAIAAGIGLGVLGVTLAQVSEGLVFGPIAVMRLLQVVVIAGLVALTGSAWRLHSRVLPLVAAVGVFDLAGNGLFLVAVQSGPLAIAAILASLYPVVTVLLATVLLGERLTRANMTGVALAAVGIALITSGSG